MIIALSPSRLNNVDILSSNGVLNLESALANGEFTQDAIAGWHSKCIANGLNELRVRVPAQNNNIANHDYRRTVRVAGID